MQPFPPTAEPFASVIATRDDAQILYALSGAVLQFQHQCHQYLADLIDERSAEAASWAPIDRLIGEGITAYLAITPDEYQTLTPETLVRWYPTKGDYYALPIPDLLASLTHGLGRIIEISVNGFMQCANATTPIPNPRIYAAMRHDLQTMSDIFNLVRVYGGREPIPPLLIFELG